MGIIKLCSSKAKLKYWRVSLRIKFLFETRCWFLLFLPGSNCSFDHITPLIKSLHCLPVEARIHFLLITFKILNGQSAGYLKPLIKDYRPLRTLRSSSCSLLYTPAIKSKTYGGCAFSTAAPQLWNTIPEYIKNVDSIATFKTKLKTSF